MPTTKNMSRDPFDRVVEVARYDEWTLYRRYEAGPLIAERGTGAATLAFGPDGEMHIIGGSMEMVIPAQIILLLLRDNAHRMGVSIAEQAEERHWESEGSEALVNGHGARLEGVGAGRWRCCRCHRESAMVVDEPTWITWREEHGGPACPA